MLHFCYTYKKAIRLPITDDNIEKIEITQDNKTPFWSSFVDSRGQKYIDLVLDFYYPIVRGYNFDDENFSAYQTKANYLSDKEKEFFVPYFDKLGIAFEPDDLRKADYCWDSCCEPPDCYDVTEDDWTTLIGIYGY